jgi:drug/metabolite transporter (DMT)-like permease
MKLDGRPIVYTTLALLAFAGNSILCRMALGRAAIDAATFSTIRFAAGAAMLVLVMAFMRGGATETSGSWPSAAILFLYAVPFSFAYVSLNTGTGALILFGAVQVTMMLAALWSGERPHPLQWLGLGLALGGLVYLVLPGLAAPSAIGSALMALAGISWGIYSLRGRGIANPLAQTTSNFVRTVPLVIAVSLIARAQAHITWRGALLALASGALTTGLGYVLWYSALRRVTATRAAVVQLTVPVLAAAGGVIFLGETISSRLVVSAMIVLGGISLALVGRERREAHSS